ncbi:hypothetical protein H5410_054488 [Solanum commersonii]|uniref:Uncharacterized protein n=1 Tax=Solanum commersonii TaxID=4109 RepID=A0A9J5WFG1_SOLCO|nr:hypothetical protein H5410_054488 [Solanum commersonii]
MVSSKRYLLSPIEWKVGRVQLKKRLGVEALAAVMMNSIVMVLKNIMSWWLHLISMNTVQTKEGTAGTVDIVAASPPYGALDIGLIRDEANVAAPHERASG